VKRAATVNFSVTDYPKEKEKRVNYVLDMISLFLGVKLEASAKTADVAFPAPDFESWRTSNVKVTYIKDIPVLYTKEKPLFLVRDGKVGFDILAAMFWLLSRQEEAERRHRDQWGNFRSSFSALSSLSLLYKPFVNYWVKEIASYIDKHLGIARIPLWKDGKAFAAALTHDVDLVNLNSARERFRVYKLLGRDGTNLKEKVSILASPFYALLKRMQSERPGAPCFGFEKWLRLEEGHNAKSTFFFFADAVKRKHAVDAFYRHDDRVVFDGKQITVGDMIKRIAAAGWEVGLHGSYYSSEDLQELQFQKARLERTLQEDVRHVRQHFLRFNITTTPLVHERSGFHSDATLGFNRNIGFRAGIGYPFKLWNFEDERESATWEIPLVIQDGALLQMDFLGLTDLDLALEACIRLAEEAENSAGLISLLWHPHTVANTFYPGWFMVYERLLKYLAERHCWLASVGEVTAWWERRREMLLTQEGPGRRN
jgi:peptidoglycan/xylan/chitin deacetylase (PgdA/CDA1 family)